MLSLHCLPFLLSFGMGEGDLAVRSVQDFRLSSIVLLATLDGALQARDRSSGELLWSLAAPPAVDIVASNGANASVEWLASPTGKGTLYLFSPDSGVQKVPLSVCELIGRAPFGQLGQMVYTGAVHTTMYALDSLNGRIVKSYGEQGDSEDGECRTRPVTVSNPLFPAKDEITDLKNPDLILLGRTQYTLEISDHSDAVWTITLNMWTPNARDEDLKSQYRSSMDGIHLTPLNSRSVMALVENAVQPQRWLVETPALLIAAFDVLEQPTQPVGMSVDGLNGAFPRLLAAVPQPPLALPEMALGDWFIENSSNNGRAVVEGELYAALLSSASVAPYCTNKQASILGKHPVWCQNPANHNEQTRPVYPLLPPAPVALLDGPERGRNVYSVVGLAVGLVLTVLIVFMWIWRKYTNPGSNKPVGSVNTGLEGSTNGKNGKNVGETNEISRIGENNEIDEISEISENTTEISENNKEISGEATEGVSTSVVHSEPRKRKRGSRGGRPKSEKPFALSNEVLGHGSHGTTVFRGKYQGREVAVKRLLLEFHDLASQEVAILQESDDHPNVVRYYCQHQADQFLYIALELCPATLEKVVRAKKLNSQLSEPSQPSQSLESLESSELLESSEHAEPAVSLDGAIVEMFDALDALSQIVRGLQHLHSLQIVHRDIKPQNILVSVPKRQKSLRYLLSDFGLCKKLNDDQSSFLPTRAGSAGTSGWTAPEALVSGKLTKAVDVFSLGCVFYYVLSGGTHPFGEPHLRQANIMSHQPLQLEAELVGFEAKDLISRMLDSNPRNRPTTQQVLEHPLFWPAQQRLDFLVRVSDRLEHESRELSSDLIARLEAHAVEAVGADWHSQFPAAFVDNLGKYRRYHGDRIIDLLRALRNKLHHYNDYSPELKQCVGSVPTGFLDFFTSRFPKLLMIVYHYAREEFFAEDAFALYWTC